MIKTYPYTRFTLEKHKKWYLTEGGSDQGFMERRGYKVESNISVRKPVGWIKAPFEQQIDGYLF